MKNRRRAIHISLVLLALAGLVAAQVGEENPETAEAPTTSEGQRSYPVESAGDRLINEGRYEEARDFFANEAARNSGLQRDLLLIRQAAATHLAGYHNQAWELLKEVCQRRLDEGGAISGALYRAIDEMIINRRALRRHRPYRMPTDPDALHPRDDFHFSSLNDVPDLRRTTRAGDVANLDIESMPETDFVELTEEELAELTPREREEYEGRLEAWRRDQRRLERLAAQRTDSRSNADFDLYYATFYLALLREFDPRAAAELKQRIINEVINVELETVAWYVNYSHICADVDSAIIDAESSAAYWSESHNLLTREVARMLGERFNLYLFSRQCGTGIGMHDIRRAIGGYVRKSVARTVTVRSYGGDGIANPGYRAYAALNGSLVISVGDVLRRLHHHPESWHIPLLRDFSDPEESEAFLAGAAEGDASVAETLRSGTETPD